MARPICEYIEKYGTDTLSIVLAQLSMQTRCSSCDCTIESTEIKELLEEMVKFLTHGLRDEATRCKGE